MPLPLYSEAQQFGRMYLLALQLTGGRNQAAILLQGDLWQWYLEPSLYGTEIVTLGGSRGPSVSYYVPYLSAMQLLLPLSPEGHASQAPQQQLPVPSSTDTQSPMPVSLSQQQHQSSESAQHSQTQQGDDLGVPHQSSKDLSEQQPAAMGHARPGRVYQVGDDGKVCFQSCSFGICVSM